MKILQICSLYPPEHFGGAEDSAFNLGSWLAGRGHEVHVLASAASRGEARRIETPEGVAVWREFFPRPYPIYHFPSAPAALKPLWHLADHAAPGNRRIGRKVLDAVAPDLVAIHMIQGAGYNILRDVAARDVPVVYYIHDLGLACVRMSMFSGGRNCEKLCLPCALSADYKRGLLRAVPRIGFCSPSQAHLDRLRLFQDLGDAPRTVILNANAHPGSDVVREPSLATRFIHVGRVHRTKGIDILLKAAARVQAKAPLSMTVVGDGPDLGMLEGEYGDAPWCRFTGRVSRQEVADLVAGSDVLCAPAVYRENSPGTVIHALSLGVPVLGSRIGGIPELVKDGLTGALVAPGSVDAWACALEKAATAPGLVDFWRSRCAAGRGAFSQDALGERHLAFFDLVRGQKGRSR
jgi:glycosyltransferase involved in cell wall biosynthesis